MGGNLTQCDEWTKSLLTNAEVIAVDQHSKGNRSVETTAKAAVWTAEREGGDGYYVAVFNRLEAPQSLHYEWKQLGLNARTYSLRDLWEHKDAGRQTSLDVKLPAHASVLYFSQADGKR
jgi:alpha-galactosidase